MSVWYLTPVLVQDLQILINIATALLATLFGPFAFGTNLVTLKLLVFNVLLPCACMCVFDPARPPASRPAPTRCSLDVRFVRSPGPTSVSNPTCEPGTSSGGSRGRFC